MTHQAAEGGHGRIGPKASPQEPKGVQLLDPLAVEDVTLASGHSLDVAGVDEEPKPGTLDGDSIGVMVVVQQGRTEPDQRSPVRVPAPWRASSTDPAGTIEGVARW